MKLRAVAAPLIVLAAFAVAGCGASPKPLSTKINSPSEVRHLFAAHGLRLVGVAWNLRTGDINGAALLADEVADANAPASKNSSLVNAFAQGLGKGPLHYNHHELNLTLIVWWSDAAAEKTVSHTDATPVSAAAPFRSIGVDNVTAQYIPSPENTKLVARLRKTMAALATAPGVKAPA